MVFCIAVELIVVLVLVLVVGWNYGMGTQLFDWIEQMRKPVVKAGYQWYQQSVCSADAGTWRQGDR